jgi:hypothetical protein
MGGLCFGIIGGGSLGRWFMGGSGCIRERMWIVRGVETGGLCGGCGMCVVRVSLT